MLAVNPLYRIDAKTNAANLRYPPAETITMTMKIITLKINNKA